MHTKYGKDISNITSAGIGKDIDENTKSFAKGTAAYYLEQIIENANAKGWNVALKTDGSKITLGLYPQDKYENEADVDWGEIATIDIGLVDDNATIKMGGVSNANVLFPTVRFDKAGIVDGEQKWKVNSSLESANERQLANIAGAIGGSGKVAGMLEKGMDADMRRLGRSLGHIRDLSLRGLPTTASSSVLKEATSDIQGEGRGGKTREQMVGVGSTVSVAELAKELYSNGEFRQEVNQFYKDTIKEDWKRKDVDPYELTQAEIEAVMLAYAMIAEGFDSPEDSRVRNLKDGLVKRILTSDALRGMRENIKGFINAGIRPSFESTKEESFISGLFTFSGSHDVLPFNMFGDFSNRGLNQIFNRNRRANAPTMARNNIFTSEIGRNLGVDYDSMEMSQYVGATTTDEELFNALKEVLELTNASADELRQIVTSVKEGGMIIPQSMAKELASYREVVSKASSLENLDVGFLQRMGLSKEFLENMESGEFLGLNHVVDTKNGQDFSTTFHAEMGDIIVGIQKTGDGYRLVTEKLAEVHEATKLLTDIGGRQTARILDDEIYNKLINKLGLSGA